jgi:hypothetical protein
VDDTVAKGTYSNVAVIFHNQNEFIMDFAFVHPPKAKVVSRVITSPAHAKSFLKAMDENIKQYEKKFGSIKETEGLEKSMNIKISNN